MNIWQGKRIKLRAIEPSDAGVFFEWNQDSEMSRNLDFVWPPTSLEFVRQWLEKKASERPEGDLLHLVMENDQGQVVGSISTHRCDRRTGTFSYGLNVRPEHQRQGYASEAIVLVLRYFFEELRYQKAWTHVHSDNIASIRLHERLGFQLEGRLRRMLFSRGQYLDDLVYGVTVEEFQAVHSGL